MFSQVASLISSIGSVLTPNSVTLLNSATSPTSPTLFDFDGDGKSDISRFQKTTGEWRLKSSVNGAITNTILGSTTSKIVPADFDGDGKTDVATFNNGTWTIKQSATNTTVTHSFGISTDKPVVGDYDGDGKADLAFYRAGTWNVRQSSNGVETATVFGNATDIPTIGDFDNDGKNDFVIYRPADGIWHRQLSNAGYSAISWGISTDIPVAADYDGDGKTDCAVFRPTTGTWYVYKSSTNNGEYIAQAWGNYGDQPTPADFDGDGKADFSVWRPSTGVWHTIKSSDQSFTYETLGIAGDVAVQSAYIKQTGASISSSALAKSRLAPINETGGTSLYSRNFGWGTALAGLSGRGLNAGFGISYNSLIWTKQTSPSGNNSLVFDADNSNVSPGFRFGFPVIEPAYFDKTADRYNFIMVSPNGSRTEFQQIGATNVYETADSSYTQLTFSGASSPNSVEQLSITVKGTDGTLMKYLWNSGAYRLTQVKDANGNLITISHNTYGLLTSVTDTLGRIINVNYNNDLQPTTVTQTWQNGLHTYATLSYKNETINTNFDPTFTVYGPPNGTILKVLDKITFADNSSVRFDYNVYGQVKQVNNHAADGHKLNHTRTNLGSISGIQTDCPRFTETKNYVQNFNAGAETIVTNSFQTNQPYTLPDGGTATGNLIEVAFTGDPHARISKTFTGNSGWKEGLPIKTEDFVNGVQKRWTWTDYGNSDTLVRLNPRVIESKVGDTENGNIRRTKVEYNNPAALQYGLPSDTLIYDTDQTTILKKSTTEYNLSSVYTNKRIIGLPSKSELYDGIGNLQSKVTYQYDEGDFLGSEQNISPIQHDATNFGVNFIIGRGNMTSTTLWDVNFPNSLSQASTSSVKYNTAGSTVSSTDAVGRVIKLSYADSFDTTLSLTSPTYAFPTKITDPNQNSSFVKYRYDIGLNVRAESPAPEGQAQGKISVREFDSIGRLTKEKIQNYGGAYTRYEYPTNGIQSKVYTTITDINGNGADAADEVFSESWTDGDGRVRKTRSELPNSFGGFSGSLVEYDILGQVKRSTVPTEIAVSNANDPESWQPAGDDLRGYDSNNQRIWLWKSVEFDWKGRPTRSINTDGTDKTVSYEGCGCAGGQVTTIKDELVPRNDQPTVLERRTRKIYADILGRNWKTENLNWDGSVYSSSTRAFNGRNQATILRSFKGIAVLNNEHQDTIFTYDGRGRLKTQHFPQQQDATTVTSYTYNADDSVQSTTDGRGVVTSRNYNNLGLLENVSSTVPSGSNIRNAGSVSFTYDTLGNKTQMTDNMGTLTYQYDELSRLTLETRHFFGENVGGDLQQAPGGVGTFNISYDYDLTGNLKSLTDPYGQTTNYANNKLGQTESINGSWFAGGNHNYANNAKYRAWGAVKSVEHINNAGVVKENYTYNNRLQNDSYIATNLTQGGNFMQKQYQYNNDGLLKYSSDNSYPAAAGMFDRSYKYDQVARLVDSRTGSEARGGAVPPAAERPYVFQRTYDVWSNATSTAQVYWNAENPLAAAKTYTNNKVVGFGYDSDGRLTMAENLRYSYDSAGNQHSIESVGGYVQSRWMDGNGNMVREHISDFVINSTYPNGAYVPRQDISYNIRSSLLGGDVISVALRDGRKASSYVYGFGKVIGVQSKQYAIYNNVYETIYWDYTDPSEVTQRGTNQLQTSSYPTLTERELDPLNVDAGTSQTIQEVPEPWDYPRNGDRYEGVARCVVDGNRMDCDLVSAESLSVRTTYHSEHFGFINIDTPLNSIGNGLFQHESYQDSIGYTIIRGDGVTRIDFNGKSGEGGLNIFSFGDDETVEYKYPDDKKQELKTATQKVIDTGDCKKKLNELIADKKKKFKTKGGLTGFEALLDRFISGSKGYRLLVSDAGGGIANYVNKTIRFKEHRYKNWTTEQNVLTFIHEILHAASGENEGFSHENLAQSIANLEGLKFNKIKNERGKLGDNYGYSDILDAWLAKYCGNGGGTWENILKQFQ